MPRLATLLSDLLGAFAANLDRSAPRETTARKKRAGTSRRRRGGTEPRRTWSRSKPDVARSATTPPLHMVTESDGQPSGMVAAIGAPPATATASLPTARPLNELLAAAREGSLPAPRPLHPDGTDNPPPIGALPQLFRDAASTIDASYEVPPATALASMLGAAAFAVQRLADVERHFAADNFMPTSLFLICAGKSGERKSSVDKALFKPVAAFEEKLKQQAEIARSIVGDDGDEALQNDKSVPLGSLLLSDTSLEALVKVLARGHIGMAIASDEGGRFFSSYAMAEQNAVRTAGTLSQLWDAGATSLHRAGEPGRDPVEVSVRGQRLSMSIQVQPGLFRSFVAMREMHEQGLFARVLCADPPTRIGTRYHRRLPPEAYGGLEPFVQRVEQLLHASPPVPAAAATAPPRRKLPLTRDACAVVCDFANEIEPELAPGRRLEHLTGFGSRVSEHATRLAAVVALFDDPALQVIDADRARIGVQLARFYMSEADRATRAAVDRVQGDAETLLEDLERLFAAAPPAERVFTPRALVRRKGRGWNTERIRAAIGRLGEHGFVHPVEGTVRVGGHATEEAWWIDLP